MAYTFDLPYSPTYFHDMNPDYLAWIISNNGLHPPSVNNVLEIGCGNGLNLIIPAINSSTKFVGLDPNPTHINFAKKITDRV